MSRTHRVPPFSVAQTCFFPMLSLARAPTTQLLSTSKSSAFFFFIINVLETSQVLKFKSPWKSCILTHQGVHTLIVQVFIGFSPTPEGGKASKQAVHWLPCSVSARTRGLRGPHIPLPGTSRPMSVFLVECGCFDFHLEISLL